MEEVAVRPGWSVVGRKRPSAKNSNLSVEVAEGVPAVRLETQLVAVVGSLLLAAAGNPLAEAAGSRSVEVAGNL